VSRQSLLMLLMEPELRTRRIEEHVLRVIMQPRQGRDRRRLIPQEELDVIATQVLYGCLKPRQVVRERSASKDIRLCRPRDTVPGHLSSPVPSWQ